MWCVLAIAGSLFACAHPIALPRTGPKRTAGTAGSPAAVHLPTGADIEGFRFGVGDVMHVRVYREKELTGDFMVDPDGNVQFPLAGPVAMVGLTPNEAAEGLRAALAGRYLRNPQVSVLLKEVNSRKISVLGQVEEPGTFRYWDRMTLVEAISMAGGLTKLAMPSRVRLTRKHEGEEHHSVIALDQILEGRTTNLVVRPGDVVYVPESLF